MKICARSVCSGFGLAALAVSLTACGGGGGGSSSGVVTGQSGSGVLYDGVDDLTGTSSFSLGYGGLTITNRFSYGGLQADTTRGVTYRTASSLFTISSLSGSSTHSPILCADWAQQAEAQDPSDAALAAAFAADAYICLYLSSTGSERWYELNISNEGAITGGYVFKSAGSSANALASLSTNPTASIFGTHSTTRNRLAESPANDIDLEVYDAIEASVLPYEERAQSRIGQDKLSIEEVYMRGVSQLLQSQNM